MKSIVLSTGLLGVILASGLWLMWYYFGGEAPGDVIPHMMPVACEACGKAYAAKVGNEPATCLFCGERQAWRAIQCTAKGCGFIYPLIREEGEATPKARPCPKCGGRQSTWRISANELDKP